MRLNTRQDVKVQLRRSARGHVTVSKELWHAYVARYGDYEARQRLRWICRPLKASVQADVTYHRLRRDGLALVMDLVHTYPGLSPTEARKKFATAIRSMLRAVREHRERIMDFCVPGVPRQILP